MKTVRVEAACIVAGDEVLIGLKYHKVEAVLPHPVYGMVIKLVGQWQTVTKDWSDWVVKVATPEPVEAIY